MTIDVQPDDIVKARCLFGSIINGLVIGIDGDRIALLTTRGKVHYVERRWIIELVERPK